MYYPNSQKEFRIFSQILKTLLVVSLIVLTRQSDVFAGTKEKTAKEYRIKGYEAQQQGKLDEALSLYTKAAALGINRAAILNDIGVIYEKLGILDKAEENYAEAIRIDSGYLPAYTNLAYLYKNTGHIAEAAEYFKKRIERGDPEDPWTKKAQEGLEGLGDQSPRIKKWLMNQQVVQLREELSRKARKDFHDSIAKASEYYRQGKKFVKSERYTQAIDEYNRALSFTPDNPKILNARKEAMLMKAKKEAKEHADSALKMLDLGDTVSAKIEFSKILAIIPNEPVQVSK